MSDAPTIRVYTFKEGLLSRLAHDLQFRVQRFQVELDKGRLQAAFQLDSLKVDGVMRSGSLDPEGLSRSDKEKVIATATRDVLDTKHYPEARFEGDIKPQGDIVLVDGALTLVGRRCALPRMVVTDVGDELRIEVTIQPSRWGIRPYRAMAGALRLQDNVRIELAVPRSEELDLNSDWHVWKAG